MGDEFISSSSISANAYVRIFDTTAEAMHLRDVVVFQVPLGCTVALERTGYTADGWANVGHPSERCYYWNHTAAGFN